MEFMRHCPHFLLAQNRKINSIVSQASQSGPHHHKPVKRSGQTRTDLAATGPGLAWLGLTWLERARPAAAAAAACHLPGFRLD